MTPDEPGQPNRSVCRAGQRLGGTAEDPPTAQMNRIPLRQINAMEA